MIDFVNKNFMPHLSSQNSGHEKSINHWRQLTELIKDIERVHIWNLERCLRNIGGSSMNIDLKEPPQPKKSDSSRPSGSNYGSYDSFLDKKEPIRNTFSYEDKFKVSTSVASNGLERPEPRNQSFKTAISHEDFETNMSNNGKHGKGVSELSQDPQGFDKLILSFRRMCNNFQNNHRKLLKQDQNLKENLKV